MNENQGQDQDREQTQLPEAEPETETPHDQTLPVQDIQSTGRRKVFGKPANKKRLLVLCVILCVVVAGGVVYAYKYHSQSTTSPDKTAALAKTPAATPSAFDRTFVRYMPDSEYSKIDSNDSDNNVRANSFNIQVEHSGVTHNITLTNQTVKFGEAADGGLYSLSCNPVPVTSPGAENLTFSATFYDKTGKELSQKTFKQRDASAPLTHMTDLYCGTYFTLSAQPTNFTPSGSLGFGQQKIDSLNYNVYYVKPDGQKKEAARENSSVVDLPLAISQDHTALFYNQVTAKRTFDTCVSEQQLPYKVPNFDGSVNDLHMVNLTTGTDTNLGAESTFSVSTDPISLSNAGYFSPDGSRYYLREGIHHGCAGGNIGPLHIPYIDVKTVQPKAITAPEGLPYTNYCYNANHSFAIEYQSKEDFTLSSLAPSVLNLNDGSTYQLPQLTSAFGGSCGYYSGLNTDNFAAVLPSTDQPIKQIAILDPVTRNIRTITLDKPVFIDKDTYFDSIDLFSDGSGGYINRSSSSLSGPEPQTILFDNSGKTKAVPYAQLVL